MIARCLTMIGLNFFFWCSVAQAGVYWLPDYLQDNMDRNQYAKLDDNGAGKQDLRCETYGLHSPSAVNLSNMECDSYDIRPLSDLKCYQNCSCKASKFPYSSSNCSGSKTPSGSSCGGKYSACTCKSEFKYDRSNCSGEYTLSGSSCDGKYNSCSGKSCYQGGYYSYRPSDMECQSVTYGGNTCYDCYTPSCPDGGYSSSSSVSGKICTSVSYYGQTCYQCDDDPCYGLKDLSSTCLYGCEGYYSQCSDKCESCYADNCRNRADNTSDYGCEKPWDDCPDKCESGKTCTPQDCSDYPLASKPGYAAFSTCVPGCKDTKTYYKIDSCNEGYQLAGNSCTTADCDGFTLSSCPSAATSCSTCKKGTSTKYKIDACKEGYELSGTSCTAAACDGYVSYCSSYATSCSTCLSGTSTRYRADGCKDGYILNNGSCTSNPCDGYSNFCPTGANCATCKSGTSTRYKVISCQAGYELSGTSCTAAACDGYVSYCSSYATSCSTCLSGTSTRYRADGCKDGYILNNGSCTSNPCDGYSNFCPTGANCATCKSGTSTRYKVISCQAGYELSGTSCTAAKCEGYSYSCPSIATDCETCLSGTSTKYRIKTCPAPLNVNSTKDNCECAASVTVKDEASFRTAMANCSNIIVDGTINITGTSTIYYSAPDVVLSGINNATIKSNALIFATSLQIKNISFVSTDFDKYTYLDATKLILRNVQFTATNFHGSNLISAKNFDIDGLTIKHQLKERFAKTLFLISMSSEQNFFKNINIDFSATNLSLSTAIKIVMTDDTVADYDVVMDHVTAKMTGQATGNTSGIEAVIGNTKTQKLVITNSKFSVPDNYEVNIFNISETKLTHYKNVTRMNMNSNYGNPIISTDGTIVK